MGLSKSYRKVVKLLLNRDGKDRVSFLSNLIKSRSL